MSEFTDFPEYQLQISGMPEEEAAGAVQPPREESSLPSRMERLQNWIDWMNH